MALPITAIYAGLLGLLVTITLIAVAVAATVVTWHWNFEVTG